jgi:hypothetical protein
MNYSHDLEVTSPPLPRSEFETLSRMKPEATRGFVLRYKLICKAPSGDGFIQHALSVLERHHIPRLGVADNRTSYGYVVSRYYEPEDLECAQLLLVTRQNKIQDSVKPPRDEQGRIYIVASKARASLKVGRIWPNWIVVSNAVRRSWESAGLVGLKFADVTIKGRSSQLSPEPFWELLSSVTLPPMVNRGNLVHPVEYPDHPNVEPFQGDHSRSIYINDEPFAKGELHYRGGDLAALGPFDIAQTFEKYMEPHPALVVSQRFYQHCLKHKIPLEVEPVRIDPD